MMLLIDERPEEVTDMARLKVSVLPVWSKLAAPVLPFMVSR